MHKLDDIDLQILKLLQEDGRMSNVEISTQVGEAKAIKSENMELKSLQKEASFLTRLLSIFSSKK